MLAKSNPALLQKEEGESTAILVKGDLKLRCTTTYSDKVRSEASLAQLEATSLSPRWIKPSARLTLIMLLPERRIKRIWSTRSMRKAPLEVCSKHSDELRQFAAYIDYRIANSHEIRGPFPFLKDVALASGWSRRVEGKDAITG